MQSLRCIGPSQCGVCGVHTFQLVQCVQAKLDTLDEGARKVSPKWHDWGNAEEGGATKPSQALA